MDKNKKLNREFNEIYDIISEAHDKLNEFYMKHCYFGDSDLDKTALKNIKDILYKLSDCKEDAHEIAEQFTWNN